MAWSADWRGVCHGARFEEGPVLVGSLRDPTLFMLARKTALRVAPLLSSPSLRAMMLDSPGRDAWAAKRTKGGSPIEPESLLAVAAA